MKKGIIILIVLLASIGCEREKCKHCTTITYHNNLPIAIYETDLCGEQLEFWDDKIASSIDTEGNIDYFMMTVCK
jgi:hypothetical protein